MSSHESPKGANNRENHVGVNIQSDMKIAAKCLCGNQSCVVIGVNVQDYDS